MMAIMAKNRIRALPLVMAAVTRTLCCTPVVVVVAGAGGGEYKPLYRRLSALGGDPKGSVEETMEGWRREGRSVTQYEVMVIVRELRRYKSYNIALELTDWMETKGGEELTVSSYAVRLDLIYKVKGIEMAERYFSSLPKFAKNRKTYGALLNSYCQEKMVDKAIALFEKLKQLNYASCSLVYNLIMTLYMKLGQPDKVLACFQEMREANITPDTATFSLLMNTHASLNDIDSAEKVVEEMKRGALNALNWSIYCNLASLYNSQGLFEKSESVLEEAEKVMNHRDRTPYHFLINLYAATGNSAKVKSVWKSLKASFGKTTNQSYFIVLNALRKLGDVDGVAKIFEEWESCYDDYDVRLANVVIDAYLKKGMGKEAELHWKKALEKGVGADFKMLDMFANYYMERHESDLATKCLKLMTCAQKPYGWKPNKEKVNAFLNYFEEVKDVGGAEEVFEALKKLDYRDTQAYESLLRTYLAAGRKDASLHQRIVEDEIEVSSEIVELLERVCFDD